VDEIADQFVKTFPDSKNSKAVSRKLIEVAITIPDAADVKKSEFKRFMARFGPFDKCFHKAAYGLFQDLGPPVPHPWFHGKQNRADAQKIMMQDKVHDAEGHFLVRFSEKYPSDLVLSYSKLKDEKLCYKSVVIHNGAKGYHLHGKDENFGTVAELIASEKKKGRLMTPIVSSLFKITTGVAGSTAYSRFTPESTPVTAAPTTGGPSHAYSVWKGEAGPGETPETGEHAGGKYVYMPEASGTPGSAGSASGDGGIYTTFTPSKHDKR